MASVQRKNIAESDIRTRSYLIWEREGRPEGRQLDHWLRAQAELKAEASSREKVAAGTTRPKAAVSTKAESKSAKSDGASKKAAAPRGSSKKGARS